MVIRRLFGSSFSSTALIDKAISQSSPYLGGLTYASMSADHKFTAFESASTNSDILMPIFFSLRLNYCLIFYPLVFRSKFYIIYLESISGVC